MQREIKFRGKTINSNQWVFGDLLSDWAGTCQIWEKDENNASHNYIVVPETVGQYTGLKDKNGKEIYEGDIIQAKDLICEVRFGECAEGFIGFYVKMPEHANMENPISSSDYRNTTNEYIEAIGNIHENPELLTPIINNQ